MSAVPKWAHKPGPDWKLRSLSNIDVVWERGYEREVQHAPELGAIESPIVRPNAKTRLLQGGLLVGAGATGAALFAVASWLVHLL